MYILILFDFIIEIDCISNFVILYLTPWLKYLVGVGKWRQRLGIPAKINIDSILAVLAQNIFPLCNKESSSGVLRYVTQCVR